MARTEWPNVVAQKWRSGRVAFYYRVRRVGVKPLFVRMPDDPTSPEFAEKWKMLSSPETGNEITPFSFRRLIDSYRASPRFTKLSALSKRDYHKRLEKIGDWLGDKDASRYPRPEVIRMRDAHSDKAREANYLVSVMSVLMEHAIDLGWRNENPAKGVSKFKLGAGYQPWSEIDIEKFRAVADPITRLIFELALGSGQRPGDLPKMRWSDFDGDEIRIVQNKTGAELWIPPTASLRDHLETAKQTANGLTILSTENGQPFTYYGIAARIRRFCKKANLEGVSLHGLRKNATIELAEAGCTDSEIMAITGHSTREMVTLYSRGARKKRLARSARKKTQ